VTLSREQEEFPTRNYPYRAFAPHEARPPEDLLAEPPAANTLYRRVVGLDAQSRRMTAEELEGLADPMGRLLRSGKPFPLTLRQLLRAVDELDGTPDALPKQLIFLAGDGGHIPWSEPTDRLQRSLRFVVARGPGDFTLLAASSTAVDSSDNRAFLQIIGWDETHEVFQYYERLAGTFFWAGRSHHALEDGTRGKGPFDSHVNGSLVMKELRSPWVHWHAPQAGINEESLAPDDPLRNEEIFRKRVTAERLEVEVVRPGIRRWNEARVRSAVGSDKRWTRVPSFLRQVVTDTTVNLATSETASALLTSDTQLAPPLSFFLNRDVLFDTLGLEPTEPDVGPIAIPGALYLECLRRYDVHRSDGSIRVDGDVHFAFLTPEPAFEDTHLAEVMLRAGLLTPRFLACLSMTDFTNPVFSPRRAALLRYVPDAIAGPAHGQALAERVVDRVRAAVSGGEAGAASAGSPEREFLANWDTPDHEAAFVDRITAYLSALRAGSSDAGVVDGWFRLAEHRRRLFRRRKLAEFALTVPRTNIPDNAPDLRMNVEGRADGA
jgi:hypothetical protein